MSSYVPFAPFADWLDIDVTDSWSSLIAEIRELAQGDEVVLRSAYEVAKRAAALETGAIEGLYQVGRGLTLSMAASAMTFSAAVAKEKARGLIEAQIKGYDYVIDLATGSQPLAETWVRQLHAVVCEAQATYVVRAADGERNEPLLHGQYKSLPNNVLQKNGVTHYYADPSQVQLEMSRLIEEIRSPMFLQAPPALQAAYTHHALTAVHPFSDGNGRVARAFASVYTYKSAKVPLLLFSESKDEYFDALAEADEGQPQAFVSIVDSAVTTALKLVLQSVTAARQQPLAAVAKSVARLNYTTGGFSHLEVDQAAGTADAILLAIIDEKLKEVESNELTFSIGWRDGGSKSPPEGYRPQLLGQPKIISCTLTSASAVGENKSTFNFFTYVPLDCLPNGEVLLVCDGGFRVGVGVRELCKPDSALAQLVISLWLDQVLPAALSSLMEKVSRQLKSHGLG